MGAMLGILRGAEGAYVIHKNTRTARTFYEAQKALLLFTKRLARWCTTKWLILVRKQPAAGGKFLGFRSPEYSL